MYFICLKGYHKNSPWFWSVWNGKSVYRRLESQTRHISCSNVVCEFLLCGCASVFCCEQWPDSSLVFRVSRDKQPQHPGMFKYSHVFCQQVFNSRCIRKWVNFQVTSQQLMVNYYSLSCSSSLCKFHCASSVTSFSDVLRGYHTKNFLSSFYLNSVI